jgi:hypothetical protein
VAGDYLRENTPLLPGRKTSNQAKKENWKKEEKRDQRRKTYRKKKKG